MFYVSRRGAASLYKVARITTASSIFFKSVAVQIPSVGHSNAASTSVRHLHAPSSLRQEGAARSRYEEDDHVVRPQTPPSITKFEELANQELVNQIIIDNIVKGMGHHTMTEVQALTINETLRGTDVIAQARTGTGKTLGFLVPVIQNILRDIPHLTSRRSRSERARPSDIRAIIISPTRELAEQIAIEAEKLTRDTGIVVQRAVGGNSKGAMLRQAQREGCHLLVGTPGRINDLLSDPYSRIEAPSLTALVLDEADRLLDDGFSTAIEDIIDLLPDREKVGRQTLMFSATIPREVMGLVRRTLKPDFQFVQTVKAGEQATHERIPQMVVSCRGVENLMPALLELSQRGKAEGENAEHEATPFKAIVYFSSTANVELASEIFGNLRGPSSGGLFGKHPLHPAQIFEIHGKLTQMERTRAADRFRRAPSAILFSSDVTARGMDFPAVTHVIQVGLPPNKEQYVHRVGRTGRANNGGQGWLLLPEIEMREARHRLKGLPLVADKTLTAASVDMTQDAQLPAEIASILGQIGDATKMVDRGLKAQAYSAMLSTMGYVEKHKLVDAVNQWTRYGWGWEIPPHVNQGMADRLGLGRVEGLNLQTRDREDVTSRTRGFGGAMGGRERTGFGDGESGSERGGFGRERNSFGRDRSGSDRGGRDRGGRSGGHGGFGGRGGGRGSSRSGGYGGSNGRDREPAVSW